MKEIKIGLIGAGGIAKQHLKVMSAFPEIRVVGITSRTMSRAEDLAEEQKETIDCFDSVEEMVSEAKPDALMVLVSANQMFSVCKKVIPLGLPLLIEKPAGLDPEENKVLLSLAKDHNVRVMVGYNRRFYSNFKKGLDIVRDHGKLMGVTIEGHERFWRLKDHLSEEMREKWIYANSVHTIDLLRFFGGDILQVKSIAHRHYEKNGDQFAAIAELESGAIGQYTAHWYSPGGWRVVLYGDGVTVDFEPLEEGVYIDSQFKRHEILPDKMDVEYKPGFYGQMKAFIKMIEDNIVEWPMQDLEGSYKTMLLAQEISGNLKEKK